MGPSRQAGQLRVLELFAGLGGVAAALGQLVAAGRVAITTAVDIHDGALAVYAHNFPHPTRTALIDFLETEWLERQEAHLWWLSPPCQPYTRRGLGRDAADPRARSLLHLLPRIEALRPPWIALENVPGFATSEVHRRLRETLELSGYQVLEQELCNTDFGLPNRRRRFYLLAGLEAPSTAPERPAPVHGAEPSPPLAGFLDPTPEPGLEVDPEVLRRYRHAVDVVEQDDPAAVTATFTAAYGRSPVRSGSYLATTDGVRHFSPTEILRLLGFPASYRLPPDLPRPHAWRLAGNSLALAPVRAVLARIPALAGLSGLQPSAPASPGAFPGASVGVSWTR